MSCLRLHHVASGSGTLPLVTATPSPGLFGSPVPERAAETGVSERTLYRRLAAFKDENMLSLFDSPKAKRQVLPPNIRRTIIDLKREHPPPQLRGDSQHLRQALREEARRTYR